MNRRDALSQLHKNLKASRERLDKKLSGEQAYLNVGEGGNTSGDSADLAFEADGDEMASRLAELGDRELSQIERALDRWTEGTYGICESCQKPISLARLNALPNTPLCIHCEREEEKQPGELGRPSKGNWGQVSDMQASMQDQRINVTAIELELSGNRRG